MLLRALQGHLFFIISGCVSSLIYIYHYGFFSLYTFKLLNFNCILYYYIVKRLVLMLKGEFSSKKAVPIILRHKKIKMAFYLLTLHQPSECRSLFDYFFVC